MNCELMLTYDTPADMFNVYKNQLSWQTGSRNLTGPKMLPTIWHTYMKLVTKYQISAVNSCWKKCDEKYLGRMEGRTEVKQYTPSPVERGYKNKIVIFNLYLKLVYCMYMEKTILSWKTCVWSICHYLDNKICLNYLNLPQPLRCL